MDQFQNENEFMQASPNIVKIFNSFMIKEEFMRKLLAVSKREIHKIQYIENGELVIDFSHPRLSSLSRKSPDWGLATYTLAFTLHWIAGFYLFIDLQKK